MKLAIVVLVLVAVLFAISVGKGLGDKSTKNSEQEKAKNGEHPWWTGIFSDKEGKSRMPGMTLPKKEYDVLSSDVTIPIDPSDNPFRLLKLACGPGSEVHVSFKSKEAPKDMDDPQEFTLVPKEPEDKKNKRFIRTSVVVFKSGGTLTLSVGAGPPGKPRKGTVKVE